MQTHCRSFASSISRQLSLPGSPNPIAASASTTSTAAASINAEVPSELQVQAMGPEAPRASSFGCAGTVSVPLISPLGGADVTTTSQAKRASAAPCCSMARQASPIAALSWSWCSGWSSCCATPAKTRPSQLLLRLAKRTASSAGWSAGDNHLSLRTARCCASPPKPSVSQETSAGLQERFSSHTASAVVHLSCTQANTCTALS
mmetsp:Transcript_131641/g.256430  ORF Transcript_131641/g.256430 Transcript_131641/m.256430 type:complete len:204 (-) Transcript_131641:1692-2303(-)